MRSHQWYDIIDNIFWKGFAQSEKDWVCISFGDFCSRYCKRHFCARYGKRAARRQVQRRASYLLPSSSCSACLATLTLTCILIFCQAISLIFCPFYLLPISLAVLRKWPPPIYSCLWGWGTNRFEAIVTVIKELVSPPPPLQSSLFHPSPSFSSRLSGFEWTFIFSVDLSEPK